MSLTIRISLNDGEKCTYATSVPMPSDLDHEPAKAIALAVEEARQRFLMSFASDFSSYARSGVT